MLIRHETIVLENKVLIVLSFTSIYYVAYLLDVLRRSPSLSFVSESEKKIPRAPLSDLPRLKLLN